MRDAGLFQELTGFGPLRGRVAATEHGPQGVTTREDGAGELEHAVFFEELGERRRVLIVDVAHRSFDELPDLELVDPAIERGGVRHE